MEENYLISILGRQTVNGEPEEIEVTTFGQYTVKNGKRFIVYREYEGMPAGAPFFFRRGREENQNV